MQRKWKKAVAALTVAALGMTTFLKQPRKENSKSHQLNYLREIMEVSNNACYLQKGSPFLF